MGSETRIASRTSFGALAAVVAAVLAVLVLPVTAGANHIKSPGTWTPPCSTPGGLACMPEPREGFAMTQIDNELIVSHGFSGGDTNDTRIYDIDTDTWSNPAPVPPFAIRSELAGADHGGLHYAVGGRGICASSLLGVCGDLEVYDRVTNTWAGLPPMPTPRAGLGAGVVGDTLFALGGRTGATPGSGLALPFNEAYDIDAAVWTPAAPMPFPAMDTAAISYGGKIYVIGGAPGPDPTPLLNTVQIYNVAKNTWTLGASMPTPRANLALARCGSVILALGGRTGPAFLGAAGNTAVVEAYEVRHNTWVGGLTPMPTAKSEHGAVTHGNRLYATGSGIFGQSSNAHEALRCSSLFRN
jgi:hypothetical protein